MTKNTIPVLASPIAVPGTDEYWADVGGHRMRYLRCGSGPPLLLIHGLLGYSFSWRYNFSALATYATVYAPDLLGMGFSERSPELDCSLHGTAERMLRFMDQVGLERADVVGTSHGGALAMIMAALTTEQKRVRRLVLVDPVNPWSRHGRLLTRVLATTAGAALFRGIRPYLPTEYFLRRMYGDPRRITPGTVEGYSAPLEIPGTIDHALKIAACWHSDLRALELALAAIADVPALLIWGTRDRAVAPGSARKLVRRFRNAKLVFLDGVGHLPYEETPGEFNRIVIEYLSSGDPESS